MTWFWPFFMGLLLGSVWGMVWGIARTVKLRPDGKERQVKTATLVDLVPGDRVKIGESLYPVVDVKGDELFIGPSVPIVPAPQMSDNHFLKGMTEEEFKKMWGA